MEKHKMKIEIDLNDILTDEYGPEEDLATSIKRQIIENLTQKLSKGLSVQIENHINDEISEQVSSIVSQKAPELVNDLMDFKFTPIDAYGRKGEETTFRSTVLSELQKQMVYNKKSNYSSDNNAFTQAVDNVVATTLRDFQKDFNKKVDECFMKEAFEHAYNKLLEKFKISK